MRRRPRAKSENFEKFLLLSIQALTTFEHSKNTPIFDTNAQVDLNMKGALFSRPKRSIEPMPTFSTESPLSLEPKSAPHQAPRSPADIRQIPATILRAYKAPPLQVYARTNQHLLCKTKPISRGIIMTVTSALTSTYDKKTTPASTKKQSQFKPNFKPTSSPPRPARAVTNKAGRERRREVKRISARRRMPS